MFIDVHVHPAFYEPINGDSERDQMRHAVLDIHRNGTASLEHIFNQMSCAGLDKLCLLPQDYSTTLGHPVVENEEISLLVSLAQDKFIGFASIDPLAEGALEKLEYAFADLKLAGLKLHPGRQRFMPSAPDFDQIYGLCEKYNKPVIFHSGFSWEPDTLTEYCRPVAFELLASRRPKLRFCLAHFGWPWVRETAMLLLKYPQVYADTAALYFDSAQEFFVQTFTRDIPLTWIDRSLRSQLMFGSNNPRFEQIRMAKALDHLGFRDDTLELIRSENAIVFLGGLG